MKRTLILINSLAILLAAQSAFGQIDSRTNQPTPEMQRQQEKQREINRRYGKDDNGFIVHPSSVQIDTLRTAGGVKAKKIPASPSSYYKKYGSFLQDKKADLARIFVDKVCDLVKSFTSTKELKNCESALPIPGGGSLYSFRYKTVLLDYTDWSDIRFVDGKFVAGNSAVQGVISDVGEVNFEDVNLESEAVRFLLDYVPGNTTSEVKRQNNLFGKGFRVNGFVYSDSVPVVVKHAYVLRSVAFRTGEDYLPNKRIERK